MAPSMVALACSSNTGDVEAQGSGIEDHLQLQSEVRVSLGYVKSHSKMSPTHSWELGSFHHHYR